MMKLSMSFIAMVMYLCRNTKGIRISMIIWSLKLSSKRNMIDDNQCDHVNLIIAIIRILIARDQGKLTQVNYVNRSQTTPPLIGKIHDSPE